MSWIINVIALLNQLQSYPLVQELEQCIFAGGSAQNIGQCILQKILAANLPPNTPDAAIADVVQKLIGHAQRANWGQP